LRNSYQSTIRHKMLIVGDIGNTDTKICLINDNLKILIIYICHKKRGYEPSQNYDAVSVSSIQPVVLSA